MFERDRKKKKRKMRVSGQRKASLGTSHRSLAELLKAKQRFKKEHAAG